MNLTGQEIIEQGIIFGSKYTLVDAENIQQHSVDLNIVKIEQIYGIGFVPKSGKTRLAARVIVMPKTVLGLISDRDKSNNVWLLKPGAYEIYFAQGCKIPAGQRLEIVHRSSVYRNGGIIKSSLFDAGFETDQISTQLILHCEIMIEVGARIASAYTTVSNTPAKLYDGQWQNDKQRTVN